MENTKTTPAVIMFCLLSACAMTTHRTIRNPEVDHLDGERTGYKNLFAPKYGYMSETEYDRIDFRLPHERKTRTYRLVHNPKGDAGRLMKYADTFKLHAQSPIATEQLPGFGNPNDRDKEEIFIVAISHDHFDHLNFNTLKKLPADTHFYAPLELERQFPSKFKHVTGMDWFTSDQIGDLKITFLPANHRSGRTLSDKNQSLWGGWLFEWQDQRVYFAGDSGYSDLFKELGRRYGPVDLCLMPISAWFQRHYHFAPEDAITAARDIGCDTFIPWGWGNWIMSYEHVLTPIRRLEYAWRDNPPEHMSLKILKMGETYSDRKYLPKR